MPEAEAGAGAGTEADVTTGAAPKQKRRRASSKSKKIPEEVASPDDEDVSTQQAKDEEEVPAYPTVVMQARRNMDRFKGCVLLTRVGGFYELYLEHAEEYGPLLNLKVARKKTAAGPVPMAGFPFFQLERFLKTLVLDHNVYVAVADEFPKDPGDRVKSDGLMLRMAGWGCRESSMPASNISSSMSIESMSSSVSPSSRRGVGVRK